jgi:signal transduction histidine kinase
VTGIVLGLALLAAAAAVALARWQARRLATPVARLLDRADDLGRGKFDTPPLVSGIPEIDAMATTLDRSARQIGALLERQRDFAADAAHQLRTPLTSVGLHLDEIALLGDETVRQEAEQAQAQVERLDRVITSFLARARGDVEERSDVDLSALVVDGCAPWTRLLAREGRRLHQRVEPDVWVHARRDHLLAVLGSLLDNALVHGAGTVTVSVASDGDRAAMTVGDEGPGVPPELADSVFQRRISGARGTGIGLGLAHSLAVAEDGSLHLEPPSRFVVTLPRLLGNTKPAHSPN